MRWWEPGPAGTEGGWHGEAEGTCTRWRDPSPSVASARTASARRSAPALPYAVTTGHGHGSQTRTKPRVPRVSTQHSGSRLPARE